MKPSRRSFIKYTGALAAVATSGERFAVSETDRKQTATPPERLSDLVNLMQGTNSSSHFSRGNTLPIAAVPFAMAHWTIQTQADGPWFFRPADQRTQGFRCTHQLSPWLSDYGWATIMPVTGDPTLEPELRSSSYGVATLEARPYGIGMDPLRYGIRAEIAPTCRCALMRFATKDKSDVSLIIDVPGTDASFHWDSGQSVLLYSSRSNAGGVPEGFATYYAIRLRYGQARFEEKDGKKRKFGVLRLPSSEQHEVLIGTSFVSHEQALRNLDQEIGEKSFEVVEHEAFEDWESHLSRAVVRGGSESQRRTFYSCLYRTLLFPRVWHEKDGHGRQVHYSSYTAKVEPGVLYADHGYWDVYRVWYPLMSILFPERLGEILQAWVNAGKEGGWLPQFPCPGYRACMTGSLIDAVFADAAIKGISNYDVETAYSLLRKHATTSGSPELGYGRRGIEHYLELGYVPCDRVEQSVVESLDAAYGDFCIGQIAQTLGKIEDARYFLNRSASWKLLFDSKVGFFRGKRHDGSWLEPFDELQWGSPYVEGCAWQHRWSVPHDPQALIQMMGGSKAFVEQLEEMLHQIPRFNVGAYGKEIHEMSEMVAVPFGQYAHSNQPVHHVLYLFAVAGRPDLTQYWVRRVLNELYSEENFPGDEDTGSMAAWYVLSALGLYPLCPGKPNYMLGSPLFPWVVLKLPNGKSLTIEASNQASDHVYVRKTELGETVHIDNEISHSELLNSTNLKFTMAANPSTGVGHAKV